MEDAGVEVKTDFIRGAQGPKGDKGDTGEKGDTGAQGPKGEAFTYKDLTPQQIEQLRNDLYEGLVTQEELNITRGNIDAEMETKANIINITTGTEFKTGRIVDGKEEYGKRINLGAMPNVTTKNVTTGLSNITLTRPIEGVMTAPNQVVNIPLVDYAAKTSTSNTAVNVYLADISGNALGIRTNYDWSAATGFVTLYYTKNS